MAQSDGSQRAAMKAIDETANGFVECPVSVGGELRSQQSDDGLRQRRLRSVPDRLRNSALRGRVDEKGRAILITAVAEAAARIERVDGPDKARGERGIADAGRIIRDPYRLDMAGVAGRDLSSELLQEEPGPLPLLPPQLRARCAPEGNLGLGPTDGER